MTKLYCMCEKSGNKSVKHLTEGEGVAVNNSMIRTNDIKQFVGGEISALRRHYPNVDTFTCKHCGITTIME